MPTTLYLSKTKGTDIYVLGGDIPARVDQVFGATISQGRWLFPAFRPVHARVVEDLQKVTRDLTLAPEVQRHLRDLSAPLELPEDFEFITAPFEHQKEGLLWAYNNPRCGLFYDPGLGKCKIAVDLQRLIKVPVLILCPSVVLYTWQREFKLHGNIDDVMVIDGSAKKKAALLEQAREKMPTAVVITFESAVKFCRELRALSHGAIVLDESHRAKSIHSVRTKNVIALSEGIPRRVLLSGTPTVGSPFSLYAQFEFLGKYFVAEGWNDFKKTYGHFPAHELQAGKPVTCLGYRNLDMLNKRVNEICLRKHQEECVDLPERQIIDVPFDLGGEQLKYYNMLVRDKHDEPGRGVMENQLKGEYSIRTGPVLDTPYVWTPDAVAQLSKLEQVLGGFVNQTKNNPGLCNMCPKLETCLATKVRPYTSRCDVAKTSTTVPVRLAGGGRREACRELLEDLLENPDNKVIIWTRFLRELEDVREIARDLGVEFVSVQGGMTTAAFEGAMRTFNTDPKCRIYAGQVASGIGVTLNAANYLIYYSLPWSLEQYLQSLARNYRIGQKRRVTAYRLIARESVDEAKAAALDQKVDIEAMLTDSDYSPVCARHTHGLMDAKCTCDGTVMRIVAKLRPIGSAYKPDWRSDVFLPKEDLPHIEGLIR